MQYRGEGTGGTMILGQDILRENAAGFHEHAGQGAGAHSFVACFCRLTIDCRALGGGGMFGRNFRVVGGR